MQENWSQGNWNAHVIFDCSIAESRERCRQVPMEFRRIAMRNAATYWKIQGHKPPPKKAGFAGMSKPFHDWTLIEITPKHWDLGKAHLDGANQQHLFKFGDQVMGFAAEHPVAEWFDSQGIEHHHDPDPKGTGPDFTIRGLTVDLKSVGTKGMPKSDYEAPLTEKQRKEGKGKIDWYLFGKYDNTTDGDYYILGFQTERYISDNGTFYSKGETTRRGMECQVDCWCIEYHELIKPLKWLGEYNHGKEKET